MSSDISASAPILPHSRLNGGEVVVVDRNARDQHFRTDHLLADLKGRTVRGGAVTLIAQAIKFALQMASTMVLARLLTPTDFGLIAMVTAVTGFVAMFKDAGLSMATVQREHITHEQVSTLFWINVALSIAVMVIVAALAPAIAWFYSEPQLVWITLALAGTFIFGGLTVQHQALLQRQMRFRALATVEVVSMAIGILVAIVMAFAGFGYWSLVGMLAATTISNCVLVWCISRWRPGRLAHRSGVRPMLFFGGNLTGFNVSNYFARNADNVLIGWIVGAGPLGIYSKAYSLLMLPLRQLNAPLSAVAIPAMSRLVNNPSAFRSFYLRVVSVLLAMFVPLAVAMICLAEPLILLLLGEQWMEAIPVFRLFAISLLVQPVMNSCGWLYISIGRTRALRNWGVFASVAIVSAFIVGLPAGIQGIAAAYSICMVALLLPCIYFAVQETRVTIADLVTILLRCIGATLPFALGYLYLVSTFQDLTVGGQLLLGTILFTASLPFVLMAANLWKELGSFRELFQGVPIR